MAIQVSGISKSLFDFLILSMSSLLNVSLVFSNSINPSVLILLRFLHCDCYLTPWI